MRGHADNAALVVHNCGNRTGHVGAVPVGVARFRSAVADAGLFPVALVGGVGVAAVTVAGDGGLGNEVVAGQDVSIQIGVLDDTGVDDGHGHAGTLGGFPGLRGGDTLSVVQVPLLRVQGVVRGDGLV